MNFYVFNIYVLYKNKEILRVKNIISWSCKIKR